MNSNLKSTLNLLSLEYIILDRNAIVLNFSSGVKHFFESLATIDVGEPVGFNFLEELEIKQVISEILGGKRERYKISNIELIRDLKKSSLFVNFYFMAYEDEKNCDSQVLVLIEETTSQMQLEKQVLQKSNEVSLLAMAWSASQAYLDKIINSMADALIVTNYLGVVKKINPATQEMFGYQASELLDRKISLLSPEFAECPFFESSSSTSDLEFDRNLEVACSTKSGDEIFVNFSCAKIPTEIEESPDFVCIGKDMTHRVQAEIKLRQALEKEKEINELKSRFVAMTSHELRTPLNTILFAAELLGESNGEETKELLEAIDVNIKRLTELVDYVSIVGKTELEAVELKKTNLDLVEFCRGLTYEIKLSQGNDSVLKFTSDAKRMKVNVDRKILRHTLKSLLSNAVKYSSKKEIVTLKLDRVDNDIIFWVETPGNAVPVGDRQKLLESCYSSGSLSEIPETGLGFAIAQKYARLQGGRIEVEDNAKAGTIFKVTIPDSN